MKKIILWLLPIAFASLHFQNCFGQYGHATLVIKKNGEAIAETFTFKQFPSSNFGCNERNDGGGPHYTDLDFMSTFPKYNQITVTLRITPSGTGTFGLNSTDNDQPTATIQVSLNSPAGPILATDETTSSGSVTISSYPSVGGNVIGTFKAILPDISDNKTGTYSVSGDFNIKRGADNQ